MSYSNPSNLSLLSVKNSPYIRLLLKHVGDKTWRVFFVGLFSGLANGAIVAVINASAITHRRGEEEMVRYFFMFVLAVLTYVYCNNHLLNMSVEYGERIVKDFRIRLANRIRQSELLMFDKLESSQVFVTLSDNTSIISRASQPIFKACGSSVMLLFCFAYLYFISPTAFFINIAMTITTVLIYMKVAVEVENCFSRAYMFEKRFFHNILQLLKGIKEIKMSYIRGNDLHDNYIEPDAEKAREQKVAANRLHVKNYLLTKIFVFLVTASYVFLLPMLQIISSEELTSLIAVALFMISPIGDIVQAIPELAQANVAVIKLNELENNLEIQETAEVIGTIEQPAELSVREAEFCYRDSNNEPVFCVGPLDMELLAGEVTFVVGGNGSGKSTLLKMLTGLYPLDKGFLMIDGIPVSRENRQTAREHYSSIFSDFHLFDRLYGMGDVNPSEVNKLLRKMKLEFKTVFNDGAFTRIDLSTGQRKRLALIVSLLEDRPMYIFDEVAADQDPQFRSFFYNDILNELRKRGKIVLVASHDAEYFDTADKVYRLDYGSIVDVREINRSKL